MKFEENKNNINKYILKANKEIKFAQPKLTNIKKELTFTDNNISPNKIEQSNSPKSTTTKPLNSIKIQIDDLTKQLNNKVINESEKTQ
jgi:SMC interacting uncharacterized protein involved in chromosome segregation